MGILDSTRAEFMDQTAKIIDCGPIVNDHEFTVLNKVRA
jgi:hypothetical protein